MSFLQKSFMSKKLRFMSTFYFVMSSISLVMSNLPSFMSRGYFMINKLLFMSTIRFFMSTYPFSYSTFPIYAPTPAIAKNTKKLAVTINHNKSLLLLNCSSLPYLFKISNCRAHLVFWYIVFFHISVARMFRTFY